MVEKYLSYYIQNLRYMFLVGEVIFPVVDISLDNGIFGLMTLPLQYSFVCSSDMTTVDYYMIYAAISQLLSKFQLTDMSWRWRGPEASVPGKGGGVPSRAAKTF